jgi:hypothetical protein
MIILTTDQKRPPSHLTIDGNVWPTQVLIDREQWDTLAEHGIYRHVTADGPAPLGYTDWVLVDGQYVREPAGTQAERNAYLLRQTWARQKQLKQQRQARRTLAVPSDDPAVDAKINAVQTLTGA